MNEPYYEALAKRMRDSQRNTYLTLPWDELDNEARAPYIAMAKLAFDAGYQYRYTCKRNTDHNASKDGYVCTVCKQRNG